MALVCLISREYFTAVNMVNGMSVNGLGEVSMDTTQTVLNNNLMANNLIALGENLKRGLFFTIQFYALGDFLYRDFNNFW